MKILATLTPRGNADMAAFAPLSAAEEAHVWRDYAAGRLREMYFQPAPIVVSLVFEADDPAMVEAWLAEYPMVAAGLFTVELRQLGPWLPLQALFRADALG